MIQGKLESIVTTKVYDANGNLVAEKAKCIHKSLLDWFDIIIGLSIALTILHTIFMR